jgi:hypothetical protein
MEISQPSSANEFHPGRSGPGPDLGTVLPVGVSLLDRLRKRQGERVLSPRGPTVCPAGSAGPRYDQEQLVEAVLHRRKPTKAKMTKRWNTLQVSAWGFWVGLIYGVVDQFFLSDYEDDFSSENTVSSIGPIVWAAVCGAVLFALVPAVRNAILRAK